LNGIFGFHLYLKTISILIPLQVDLFASIYSLRLSNNFYRRATFY